MKIKTISKEELETMQYDDIAYVILREKGKKMKTTDIFKTICDALDMSEAEYEAKIADFFALLATEKRFIQLDKGFWDLKENHKVEITTDDDDTEDIEIEEETNTIDEEKTDEEPFYDAKDNDDDVDEGLKDLVIIDDLDEEN